MVHSHPLGTNAAGRVLSYRASYPLGRDGYPRGSPRASHALPRHLETSCPSTCSPSPAKSIAGIEGDLRGLRLRALPWQWTMHAPPPPPVTVRSHPQTPPFMDARACIAGPEAVREARLESVDPATGHLVYNPEEKHPQGTRPMMRARGPGVSSGSPQGVHMVGVS